MRNLCVIVTSIDVAFIRAIFKGMGVIELKIVGTIEPLHYKIISLVEWEGAIFPRAQKKKKERD